MTDGEQPSFEIIFEFMQYQKVNVEMVIKRRNVLTMERIKKSSSVLLNQHLKKTKWWI